MWNAYCCTQSIGKSLRYVHIVRAGEDTLNRTATKKPHTNDSNNHRCQRLSSNSVTRYTVVQYDTSDQAATRKLINLLKHSSNRAATRRKKQTELQRDLGHQIVSWRLFEQTPPVATRALITQIISSMQDSSPIHPWHDKRTACPPGMRPLCGIFVLRSTCYIHLEGPPQKSP